MYSYDKYDEEERINIYKTKVNYNNKNNKILINLLL